MNKVTIVPSLALTCLAATVAEAHPANSIHTHAGVNERSLERVADLVQLANPVLVIAAALALFAAWFLIVLHVSQRDLELRENFR